MKQLIGKEDRYGRKWVLAEVYGGHILVLLEDVTPSKIVYYDSSSIVVEDFFEIDDKKLDFLKMMVGVTSREEDLLELVENSETAIQLERAWNNLVYLDYSIFSIICNLSSTEKILLDLLTFCNENMDTLVYLNAEQLRIYLTDQFGLADHA